MSVNTEHPRVEVFFFLFFLENLVSFFLFLFCLFKDRFDVNIRYWPRFVDLFFSANVKRTASN